MKMKINGSEIFYSDTGPREAPCVILVHGFPLSHEMWLGEIALLEKDFRVIAYDSRGLGRSEVGDGQYVMEMFCADLVALMDALAIEKAAWCGLSFGGYVILRAYEKFPERCRALVLCDTRSTADANEGKLKRAAAFQAIKAGGLAAFVPGFFKTLFLPESLRENRDHVESLRRVVLAQNPQGVCGVQLAIGMRTDTTEGLVHIKVPTLILVGEKDELTPVSDARLMHEKIPGSELVVIPHAAHMANLENPTDFGTSLREFLLKNSPALSAKRTLPR